LVGRQIWSLLAVYGEKLVTTFLTLDCDEAFMNWMGAAKNRLDAKKPVALIRDGQEGNGFVMNEGLGGR
jgi:hypothetical protein